MSVAPKATADATPSPFGDLEIHQALNLLNTDEATKAYALLKDNRQAQTASLSDAQMRLMRARAAVANSDGDDALTALSDLENTLAPLKDYILYLRSQAHRLQGQWGESLGLHQQLLREHAASPFAKAIYFDMGDAYLATNQLREAQLAYTRALQRLPRTDRAEIARFNLADIARRQGRDQEAATLLKKLAMQVPRGELGALADQYLNTLIQEKRVPPLTWQEQLSWIDKLLSARSLDEAEGVIETLRHGIAAGSIPGKAATELDYREAIIAYRRDDDARALELFERVARRNDSKQRLQIERWIARVHAAADRHEEAIKIYLNMAERFRGQSSGGEALFFAAWLAVHGGLYDKAIALFEDYDRDYPTSRSRDDAQWYKAWSMFRAGRLPDAKAALAALRQRFPRSSLVPRAHYWEGRVLASMGEHAAAQQAFAAAIDQDPVGYYGAMAKGRLSELLEADAAVAATSRLPQWASMSPSTAGHVVSIYPVPQPTKNIELKQSIQLPWQDDLFDWESPAGTRIIHWMQLGMHDIAAQEVSNLPLRADIDRRSATYNRARLLYELGEYHASYRLSAVHFEKTLKAAPNVENRHLFQMVYPNAHTSLLESVAQGANVSPLLLLAIMRQESAFNPRARSWASALGLMQIIPPTANRIAEALEWDSFEAGLMNDPTINVRFGAWYLSQLMEKFQNNLALAIGSYNAGPSAVAKWVERKGGLEVDVFVEEIPFKETRHYVKKVLSNLAIYAALYTDSPLELPATVPYEYASNIDF